jgi:hypothetical protein
MRGLTPALIASLIAGSALTLPAPASAQAATAAKAVDPVRLALGLELAKVLNPEKPTMRLLDEMFEKQAPEAMLADPNIREMEEQYPGILRAMIEAMRPIIERRMRDELPELWTQVGTFFAGELSEADLRAGIAFYGSPTGQRIIALMVDSADLGPMMTDMLESGNFDITRQQLNTTVMSGARTIETKLTPEQRAETERFVQSPAGRRIVALTPRMMTIVLAWSNAPTPEMDAEIGAAVVRVVEQFTGMKIEL